MQCNASLHIMRWSIPFRFLPFPSLHICSSSFPSALPCFILSYRALLLLICADRLYFNWLTAVHLTTPRPLSLFLSSIFSSLFFYSLFCFLISFLCFSSLYSYLFFLADRFLPYSVLFWFNSNLFKWATIRLLSTFEQYSNPIIIVDTIEYQNLQKEDKKKIWKVRGEKVEEVENVRRRREREGRGRGRMNNRDRRIDGIEKYIIWNNEMMIG